jgi:hypothetical protein
MKYLILTLSLASVGVWAQKPEVKELSDKELSSKAVAVIKDAQIDKQLDELSVFKECRDKNQFDPKETQSSVIQPKLDAAVTCFKQKIGATNNPKKLEEMAHKLNLENYGLIQSKNVKDISNYLGDKMYKSMTGVDKSSADLKAVIASMRFNNRKMVDQSDFLEMYKTQLVKNALLEISRYCFENFRYENSQSREFETHWGSYLKPASGSAFDPDKVTDIGSEADSFFQSTTNQADPYADIVKGISSGNTLNGVMLKNFFDLCSTSIKKLCDKYETTITVSSSTNAAAADISSAPVTPTKGAKSCLVKSRLQQIRNTINNTDLVMKDWNTKTGADVALTLDKAQEIKFYDGGKSNPNDSFDSLTNFTSDDMLNGGAKKNNKLDDLEKECKQYPDKEECKQFLVVDDSLAKAQHSMDMEMRLKKEIALERVRQLKNKNDKSLAEYLESEGYLDILKEYNADKSFDVEKAINKALEAKRIGALENLKNKMGKRQLSEAEAKIGTNKRDTIVRNIQYSKDERARLAQVILFNNILMSNLELKDTKNNSLGKNVNAYNKEYDAIKKNKADNSLFTNLKTEADKTPSKSTAGGSVLGTSFLDGILGKSQSQNNSTTNATGSSN